MHELSTGWSLQQFCFAAVEGTGPVVDFLQVLVVAEHQIQLGRRRKPFQLEFGK